jgi:hypothetical protein
MRLSKDLREFVELLNSNKVEYLIVGAFAVAFHGYPRYTADLDIFVRRSAENSERLLKALLQFGFGNAVAAGDFQSPDAIIQLGVSPNRIDLLTRISGVEFDEAWSAREAGDLGGVPTHFLGRTELIRNKQSTGRSKDQVDAEQLRNRV